MWRRTKNILINNQNKTKERELSDTAVKAMFDQMAAICMTMGMTYGVYVYMPVIPTMYGNSNNIL